MFRITVTLSDSEIETLREHAGREFRPTRDHARLLILRGLNIIEGESRLIDQLGNNGICLAAPEISIPEATAPSPSSKARARI